MKTFLLSVLFLIAPLIPMAQEWAPAGATWHYDWVGMAEDGYMKIWYSGDSIVGGKTCKILKKEVHTFNYLTGNYGYFTLESEYTYMANNIVYYYRYGQFFTLYDFNAAGGTSWNVAGWETGNFCDSIGSIFADSTGMTNINGHTLKYLKTSPGPGSDWAFIDRVVERIGCMCDMFPAQLCIIDVPGPGQLRCYYDDQFGLYQRPGFPPACDYITGIADTKPQAPEIKVYPNPAASVVHIETSRHTAGELTVVLTDMPGREIKRSKLNSFPALLDLGEIREGIYLLTITNSTGILHTEKIIKQ